MPSVTIKTPDDKKAFPDGTKVNLVADTDEPASAFQWFFKDAAVGGQVNTPWEITISDTSVGKYEVEATFPTGPVKSTPVTITKEAAADKPAAPATPEPQPVFHRDFAILMGVAILIGGLILGFVVKILERFGLSADDWKALDGAFKVGLSMAVPIAAVGFVAVLVGLWMALVEWRGRFLEPTPAPTPGTPATKGLTPVLDDKTIDALGKLRGPALVMLIGAVLLVSSAWVASSAAGSPTTPAATPTPTPEAT